MQKLKIGILSTANIARSFLNGIKSSSKIEAVAVASRELPRAEVFAKEFGIAKAYGSYEALLADPNLEAIYNPLPNTLHAEWTIKASNAGKHVLCEKPLAMTVQETDAIFAAAKANNVHVVEGYPWASQALTQKMRGLVTAGALGKINLIRASFGFSMTNTNNIRLSPTLGGGSLWDAGCYPISFVRVVAGRCPVRVQAMAAWAADGVDKNIVATLDFGDGLFAQVASSFGTTPHRHAHIAGDAGFIDTEFRNSTENPAAFKLLRGAKWDSPQEIVQALGQDGFFAEAESFAEMVRNGTEHWNGVTNAESKDISRILNAIDFSARNNGAVAIP